MADWKEKSLRLWQNLSSKQKYMIIGSVILAFATILAWSYWWGSRPENVALFTGLDAKDAGEVAAKLKEMKVSYEIGSDGTSILVSSKDVYRVRLDLAAQGLPRGSKGFEIFDQNKFGATEFQNKVNYLQALQGELTRTIEQMPEVEKARVHIVLPEDSLYKKNEKTATASIMVKLRPSAQLNREQVRGIVNLVAHSIQGLKAENITVVDENAHVLNDNTDNTAIGAGTLNQLELTRKVQQDLQNNLQTMLDQVLGPGKAAARINVELNFDQRTTDKTTYEPVVDDKGIIRSSQDVTETYKGTTAAPGGVPGTATNIPGYVTNGTNGQSNYDKKETTRNYEINETKDKIVAAPGSIRRLSIAVLVDSSAGNVPQNSILNAVSSATGFNASRGDLVSVEAVPFNTELADKQKKAEEDAAFQDKLMLWLKIAFVLALVGGIIYGVRWFALRRQVQREEAAALDLFPRDFDLPDEEEAPTAPELSAADIEHNNQREFIEQMAKSKPEDVAQLVKTWLDEE